MLLVSSSSLFPLVFSLLDRLGHAPHRIRKRCKHSLLNCLCGGRRRLGTWEVTVCGQVAAHGQSNCCYWRSSVTLTVTSMPRKDDAAPVKVPHNGRTCL